MSVEAVSSWRLWPGPQKGGSNERAASPNALASSVTGACEVAGGLRSAEIAFGVGGQALYMLGPGNAEAERQFLRALQLDPSAQPTPGGISPGRTYSTDKRTEVRDVPVGPHEAALIELVPGERPAEGEKVTEVASAEGAGARAGSRKIARSRNCRVLVPIGPD
jgi:hypothetical protein